MLRIQARVEGSGRLTRGTPPSDRLPPTVILSERAPHVTHAPNPGASRRIWPPDARHSALGLPAPHCHPERACAARDACSAFSASEGSGGLTRGTPPSDRLPPTVILSERAPHVTHAPNPGASRRIWPPDARHSALGPAAPHCHPERACAARDACSESRRESKDLAA